jgi:hypothetical protein
VLRPLKTDFEKPTRVTFEPRWIVADG